MTLTDTTDTDKHIFYQDLPCLPEWIERIPGYNINSCKSRKCGRDCYVVVAAYVSIEACSAFAKVFAVSSDLATPFSNMKGIWKTLHDRSKKESIGYSISEDGKVFSDDGFSHPSNFEIDKAVYDTVALYDSWRQFPQAPNLDVLRELLVAKSAVELMQLEELNGTIRKDIEDLRECMRRDREEISKCENRLTTIYENAADGMNLLEKYGVKIDLSEPEPILKKEEDDDE